MEDMLRIDVALTRRGLAQSRERAQRLVAAGLVTVNGVAVGKPSMKVSPEDALAVLGEDIPYVSRGGLKLEKALRAFDIDPTGLVCMDIGASTGGFTDVLLQGGARHVYAIDVGSAQLDPRLREDPRVTNLEHVNARALDPDLFPETPTLAVMDVSFISIQLILPAAFAVLGADGRMVALVKPQFEAGRREVGKHGVVSSQAAHIRVLEALIAFVPTLGWRVQNLDFSPIRGGDGNLEFLADLLPAGRCPRPFPAEEISGLVRRAHAAMTEAR